MPTPIQWMCSHYVHPPPMALRGRCSCFMNLRKESAGYTSEGHGVQFQARRCAITRLYGSALTATSVSTVVWCVHRVVAVLLVSWLFAVYNAGGACCTACRRIRRKLQYRRRPLDAKRQFSVGVQFHGLLVYTIDDRLLLAITWELVQHQTVSTVSSVKFLSYREKRVSNYFDRTP